MSLRCVIVDDSPGFVAAARSLLERQGLRVLGVASNCAEGLRLAAELRPDVVLVDIDLGGESGFELARRLDQMQDLHAGAGDPDLHPQRRGLRRPHRATARHWGSCPRPSSPPRPSGTRSDGDETRSIRSAELQIGDDG